MINNKRKHNKKPIEPTSTDQLSSWTKKISSLISGQGYKIYPVLFGSFPLLSFYRSNEAEIRSGDFALLPFFIFNLAVVAIIWSLAWLAIRDARKASILSVIALAIFFTFGRVHDQIQDFAVHTPITLLGPTKILVLASTAILLAVWFGLRRLNPKAIDNSNLVFTVVGVYLFLSTLVAISIPLFSGKQNPGKTNTEPTSAPVSKISAKDLPDVYYILLDGYARADILKQNFNYDNSAFINGLKKRGFYVADKSHSNYTHTHVSVPSTFNMEYLNYLTKQQGAESSDRSPLQQLTRYNKIVPIFQSMGYEYVNIGSQWGWTMTSPLSDITISDKGKADSKILGIKLDEFALVYLQTTAIKPWISSSIRGTLLSRILGAFEKTEEVSKLDEPTFSFSHINVPHPPYLFNSNGPIPGLTTELALGNPGFSDRKGFVEQTIYTNKLTLQMIDTILKNSKKPPIIIIASDHGPASSLSSSDFAQSDPAKLNAKGVRERMTNLNTYYFPDHNYSKLYQTITPVNTFRVILDQYFGQHLKLLPDYVYFSNNRGDQYRFLDVTDLVKD